MNILRRRFPILVVGLLGGCQRAPSAEAFLPGLGEIMNLQQTRHCKLWLAGQASNWDLASYEADELEEGFADAQRFHPQHKSSPAALTEVIPRFTSPAMKSVRDAIAAKDNAQFAGAFDLLTAGCNGCHVATSFGFNVVVRPTGNPFANQSFASGK